MTEKTHTTAVVLIPPQAVWGPVQAIRERHDRQFRRWMPHVTLLYPFRPREQFDAVGRKLAGACGDQAPFELELAEFRWFAHGGRRFTVWLAPTPPGPLIDLQAALQAAVPDCDDMRRFPGGFTPHLSVGQVSAPGRLARVVQELQAGWRPIRFRAGGIALIWRGTEPSASFRVDRTIPLG
ncbi:MAG: 2'-5' RNA ligase family protein [Planctomycetota bacterium]